MKAKQQSNRTFPMPTARDVNSFRRSLVERESAAATVEKYLREVRRFVAYLGSEECGREVALLDGVVAAGCEKPAASTPKSLTKLQVIAYKERLKQTFMPSTVNVAIVAINAFLKFLGAEALCVKRVRVQQSHVRRPEDDLDLGDYHKLCAAAKRSRDCRALLVVETICSTGIRVSELSSITVEAARLGVAQTTNKGKARAVALPSRLRAKLLKYAREQGIAEGPVLLSKRGRPLDRTTVWRILKRLASLAGVQEGKAYPHNLRHLFATAFYGRYRDLDGLSAILGHASVETTRIYVAPTSAIRESQIESLMLCG